MLAPSRCTAYTPISMDIDGRYSELVTLYPDASAGLLRRVVAAEVRLESWSHRAQVNRNWTKIIEQALRELAATERDLAKLWAQLERSQRGSESAGSESAPRRLGSGLDGLL